MEKLYDTYTKSNAHNELIEIVLKSVEDYVEKITKHKSLENKIEEFLSTVKSLKEDYLEKLRRKSMNISDAADSSYYIAQEKKVGQDLKMRHILWGITLRILTFYTEFNCYLGL